ncbi:MAG: hypothetical protein ABI670_19110 [Chloroflexota bacterium]
MIGKDILQAIRPFVEALEELGIAYYIGGSIASSAMGIPRSTLDADIVADIDLEHVQPLVSLLQGEYYIVDSMMTDAIIRRTSFNIIYLKNSIKIDVFLPKKEAFDTSEFSRKQDILLGEDDCARGFAIASAEDTILRKLEWYKMGGGVSDRQWLDVLGLLKLKGSGLDIVYLTTWATDLGINNLLQQAMNDAGLQPEEDIEF